MKALLEKVSRAGLGPPWLPLLSGVTSLWLLTHCCPVTLPGTRRAHLLGPPSPGRGGCDHSGAAEEGADRETGMEPPSAQPPYLCLGAPPPRLYAPPHFEGQRRV